MLRPPPAPAHRLAAGSACAGLIAGLAAMAIARGAHADDTTTSRNAAEARERDRPYTAAELTAGFLLLPGAQVCPTSTTCKRGEYNFAAGLQNVWRYHSFGVGAGLQWAASLRSDAAAGDPSLMREHSRSYFLVEALGRWYFLRSKQWDFWTGGTVGLVVLNDNWSVNDDRNPYEQTATIGPRASTLGTEGFAIGVGVGGEWSFLPNWSFGPSLRYSNWFLPSSRPTTSMLDVASLAGRNDVIDVAVRITYRISL